MVRLPHSSALQMEPIPPYSFELTVRKPAGWPLFTPFEIYGKRTIWTATYICRHLVGIKITSRGTTEHPKIMARIFLESRPAPDVLDKMKITLAHSIGPDGDLREFYRLASQDSILRHVIKDLYGMHSTGPTTIFPEAALAILLQMAPLKRSDEMMDCIIRKYGETAEFDRKVIPVWPLPERIASLDPLELSSACKLGYRAKHLVNLARKLTSEKFPTMEELEKLEPDEAKRMLLELPGIGDYSADIINPHGGFPIDAWSVEVFGKLFYGREPDDKRKAIEGIRKEGQRRWGKWSWMAFFYVVQDLENLSRELSTSLRLE
jgi:3-methyladenine DNA glycosylase/8-oxoguanine DNA glycosylase